MAYRDLAAALEQIEQLESELAVMRDELAAVKRPGGRPVIDWVMACVIAAGTGIVLALAVLGWGP
jgi:hypothetical protein